MPHVFHNFRTSFGSVLFILEFVLRQRSSYNASNSCHIASESSLIRIQRNNLIRKCLKKKKKPSSSGNRQCVSLPITIRFASVMVAPKFTTHTPCCWKTAEFVLSRGICALSWWSILIPNVRTYITNMWGISSCSIPWIEILHRGLFQQIYDFFCIEYPCHEDYFAVEKENPDIQVNEQWIFWTGWV